MVTRIIADYKQGLCMHSNTYYLFMKSCYGNIPHDKPV